MKIKQLLDPSIGVRVLDIAEPIKLDSGAMVIPRTDPRAAKADYAVCPRLGTPTLYTGNSVGECVKCGFKIYYHPSLSSEVPKICMECLSTVLEE